MLEKAAFLHAEIGGQYDGNPGQHIAALRIAKARHALPEGWVLISIPWDKIREMIRSLERMTWDLPAYSEGREKFLQREALVREEGQAIVDAEAARSAGA